MCSIRPILIVTANSHETEAFLNQKEFIINETKRADNFDDKNHYHIGKYFGHDVVHFELIKQGVVQSDAAILSVYDAIGEYNPCAVISLGIAFGVDQEKQKIGEVLISDKIVDYESIKVMEGGRIRADAPVPDAGRELLSICKEAIKKWNYEIDGEKVEAITGVIASGDKVVDWHEFREKIKNEFNNNYKVIGGEMEARGFYSACRRRGISEWIIIKAICDWGEDKGSEDKEKMQILASNSAVDFLRTIFNSDLLDNIYNNIKKNIEPQDIATTDLDSIVGYVINFGLTSYRIFEVPKIKNKKDGYNLIPLKEIKVKPYNIPSNSGKDFFEYLIVLLKEDILPNLKKRMFVKTFADARFRELFKTPQSLNNYINRIFRETGQFLSIVTPEQTKSNMLKLFSHNVDAVVVIGTYDVEILVRKSKKKNSKGKSDTYEMLELEISVDDLEKFIGKHRIEEVWKEDVITCLKDHVKGKISKVLSGVNASKVMIIKNELTFMQKMGYDLQQREGDNYIDVDTYKKNNRELLFGTDYSSEVKNSSGDEWDYKRMHGYKAGHLILETIFDIIEAEEIIPSNELCIHGNEMAYVFNVVVSGSTQGNYEKDMVEAILLLRKRGVNVKSPKLKPNNKELVPKSIDTQYNHIQAIRDCDLMFVSNKHGYIGDETKREIFAAFVLNKPIAMWKRMPLNGCSDSDNNYDNGDLSYIPHEGWEGYMQYLEEVDE